jgi:putative transposase
MGRIARVVMPGYPHHVIQRGNRNQRVFFSDADKLLYLRLLRRCVMRAGVSLWAYCLMDNHVHFIAVPRDADCLARGIGDLHRNYTNIINVRNDWRGYLWQGRFLSFPLDERYLYAAVRYVERNPVRAGIVQNAENYLWSSARAHVNKTPDNLLSDFHLNNEIADWRSFLRIPDENEEVMLKHSKTGRPLGDNSFVEKAENITGRYLGKIKPGPRQDGGEGGN